MEVRDLKFLLGDVQTCAEPYFCTLTLYDISRKLKLSEDFHFDFLRDLPSDLRTHALPVEGVKDEIEPEVC